MKRTREFKKTFIKAKISICYPTIFCCQENKVIGLSQSGVSFGQRAQVNKCHWAKENSAFLKGYRIDFSNLNPGDKISCPVCGGQLDFRLFPSDTRPALLGDTE
jgi:hypothetical protein